MDIDPAEIRRLIDKDEIREATLRYARGIDRHDDDIMSQAYHVDAIDDHGAYIGGCGGFMVHAYDYHVRHCTTHHHYIMNQTIDLDGDVAHVETYFLAALCRKTGITAMTGGRYVDRFERRADRWAIAERICVVDWRGALAIPEGVIDPALFVRGTWDKSDASYQRPLTVTRDHRDIRT